MVFTQQRRIVAKVEHLMALVDELETQLAAARATAASFLSALVAELTGTPHNGKVSVPTTSITGRRGRPRKSSIRMDTMPLYEMPPDSFGPLSQASFADLKVRECDILKRTSASPVRSTTD